MDHRIGFFLYYAKGVEKGVDFDSILGGQNSNKSGKDGEDGKLIHLTANRAKAPKRRPPSSHFNPGNNAREVRIINE